MIFILWLVTFTVSEMLLSHMLVLMWIVPVMFVILGVYYLVGKNSVAGRGDMVAYEKKIKLLTNKLYFLYSLITLTSLCIMVNMLSRLFLL